MILSNVHTHTRFSDGRDSAEDMVLEAIARGFVSLGFSDHGAAPHDDAGMLPDVEPIYRKEILRLKEKYAGQIEIALGYEHDFSMPGVDFSPYDYVIESVHFFDGWREASIDHSPECLFQAADALYKGNPYGMCRDYFDLVIASINETTAEVVGHIELIRKFNEKWPMFDTNDPRYLEPAMEVVRAAAKKDILVEVNTGAMSRGYRTSPYPDAMLLKYLKQLGGRITITSDCHRKDWLDFAFEEAAELARSCGFTENWIWKDGQFRPVAL